MVARDRSGHEQGTIDLAYHDWNPTSENVPILLIHGSPGSADDFDTLAPLLAKSRRVIAPDLLGYGGTTGHIADRSIEAYARILLELLDRLHIQRVHVVGWSNGGGVALHMADLAPDRVVSLTMLASIGLQEHEPSGSYYFEHFKYKAGKVIVGVLPKFLPHFGTLGTYESRTAWTDFFDDSDQRDLRGVMERIGNHGTPVLILHGRHDFLVPLFAALDHYQLIKSSRLVILDASHFIPFKQADEASTILNDWFPAARYWVDEHKGQPVPTSFPWRGIDDRSPPVPRTWVNRTSDEIQSLIRSTPWWAQLLLGILVTATRPMLGVILGSLLVVRCAMDPFILLCGMLPGFAFHTIRNIWTGARASSSVKAPPHHLLAHPFASGWSSMFIAGERSRAARLLGFSLRVPICRSKGLLPFLAGRTIAAILWSCIATLVAILVEALWMGPMRRGLNGSWLGEALGLLISALAIYFAVLVSTSIFSRAARRHLFISFERAIHHEYWPTWLFYAPIYPYFLWIALRNGGVRQVTCCNPDIEHGGGWAGESKHAIMDKLKPAGPAVLPTFLIPSMPIPVERVALLCTLMEQQTEIATLPIVLKPNEAQRGHAFKVLRSLDQAHAYFATMAAPAVAQPYHPGPEECGVFWMRYSEKQRAAGLGPDRRPIPPGRLGYIYAVTRKEFPTLTGDGKRTLEQLIRTHPRYRRQAPVFLDRFASELTRIPSRGETIRLAIAGNHIQGTLFRDGSDLITPDLEAEIDRIARAFPRLDYGRFDARYTTDADLKAGRGLAIIELNGASSEPTNMYDPDRSYVWAIGVLARMWRQVIELAKERKAQGVRPLTIPEFVRVIRMNLNNLTGSTVAD